MFLTIGLKDKKKLTESKLLYQGFAGLQCVKLIGAYTQGDIDKSMALSADVSLYISSAQNTVKGIPQNRP